MEISLHFLTNAFSISSSVLVARSESHRLIMPLIRSAGNCFDKNEFKICAPSIIQYCSSTVVGNFFKAVNSILESFPWKVFANRSNWNVFWFKFLVLWLLFFSLSIKSTYQTNYRHSNKPIIWEFLTNYADIFDQLLANIFNCAATIKKFLNIWNLECWFILLF